MPPGRLRLAAILFAVFAVVGLFLTSYQYLGARAYDPDAPLVPKLIDEMGSALSAAALMLPVIWIFFRLPYTRAGAARWIGIQLGVLLVYSVAHTSMLWLIRSALYPLLGYGEYNYGSLAMRYPMEFSSDFVHYALFLAALFAFDYYRRLRDQDVRAACLEQELASAQLANLRLQIQPHFLFNALNAISAAMYDDPRTADEMMSRLSDFLRMTLRHSQEQEVPLEQELRFLDLYVRIMQTRFRDRLRFEQQVDPALHGTLVPQLLLQPLVENSIQHGIHPDDASISIELHAARHNGGMRITVRDHGAGLSAPDAWRDGTGIGLANTVSRLRHLYPDRHDFLIANADGGGTMVTIDLPCHAGS